MRAIEFDGSNRVFTAPGCFDLPAFNDGRRTVVCWEFTDEELAVIAKTKRFYSSTYTGAGTPPIGLSVENPCFQHKDAFRMMVYNRTNAAGSILVWNMGDIPAPSFINCDGMSFMRNQSAPSTLVHIKESKPGDWILVADLSTDPITRYLVYINAHGNEEQHLVHASSIQL